MPPPRLPGRYAAEAAAVWLRRRIRDEQLGSAFHRWRAGRPRAHGFAISPTDLRPADADAGRRILSGAFVMADATLALGPWGDPWDRASPTRRFAIALHRFDWLRDLMAAGGEGVTEGLRLTLEWRRLFDHWNSFVWGPEALDRRVFNLACAGQSLCAGASDAETALIAGSLARQARCLLDANDDPAQAAGRSAAAAAAGAALSGDAGERLLDRGLAALERALPATVLPDGSHASRSPAAALELLFDLKTLEEALSQLGRTPPSELARAIAGLSAAVRFHTGPDGRLSAFQGGSAVGRAYVAAARAQDEAGSAAPVSLGGFEAARGPALELRLDAAPPASGAWSVSACGQPLALEVFTAGRRLIVGGGWSPEGPGPSALRLADAASTASLADLPCGAPLRGFCGKALGPRLVDGPAEVLADRKEAPGAVWLELSHDGWVGRFGLRHERRLYLDTSADEIRGEDRFTAVKPRPESRRRFIPFAVRFHLHPDVSALVARDRKSVLLKAPGDEAGWWLRNDALEVLIEPSVICEDGELRRTQQVVLRGQARGDSGARIRWKLASAAAQVDPEKGAD